MSSSDHLSPPPLSLTPSPSPSSSLPPPLPPLVPSHPLQLFTLRHGERVDQAFGNDWLEQAFRVHHRRSPARPRIKKRRQSIVTDEHGGYRVVELPPSTSPSPPHSPSPAVNTPSTFTDDYHPHHAPALPSTLHHATYVRFNLNMPEHSATHMPRRPIHHYADDSPLTQCGHWQASTVGSAFRGMGISAVYCSPALRCVQTAEEVVRACGIRGRTAWRGVRVEPGLFEWMGWYSGYPAFMSPASLRDNQFSVDVAYEPLSPLPGLHETQWEWYQRSAQLVHRLLARDHGGGNVLVVGHAGSHDVLTYSLLHRQPAPSQGELEIGSRHRLYSNYCGVSRVRWDAGKAGWLIDDDSAFDMHNTANEPFSFQLSYVSVERQRKQREAQGTATTPLTVPIDSYVQTAVAGSGPQAEAIADLNFARSFGVLLDSVHAMSAQLSARPCTDPELRALVRASADDIAASIAPLIPEWTRVAAACDGVLQSHIIRCFICVDLLLKDNPRAGWRRLSRRDRNVLSWAVLLHDVAKIMKWETVVGGIIKRDPIHPFNSAVVAARVFARMGFSHGGGGAWETEVEEWVQLVQSAIVKDDAVDMGRGYTSTLYPLKHDNACIPAILTHLGHLFGTNTLVADVVTLVLLHQSIPFVEDFPPAAALSDEETVGLLTGRMIRLLGMLHVVDSGSYQMADRRQQDAYVGQIWEKVEQLERRKEESGVQVIGVEGGEEEEVKEGGGEVGDERRGSDSSAGGRTGEGSEGRGSVSSTERMGLMDGFGPSSSFVVDEEDEVRLGADGDASGADAVVLTVDNAAQFGLSPERVARARGTAEKVPASSEHKM